MAAAWESLSGGRWHWHLRAESPSGEVTVFSPSVSIKYWHTVKVSRILLLNFYAGNICDLANISFAFVEID